MYLNKIDDPRDSLERANKRELVNFAHANGFDKITYEMPAIFIRKFLRAQGVTRIEVPYRQLGASPKRPQEITNDLAPMVEDDVAQVNADDDLAAQFGLEIPKPKPVVPEPKEKHVAPNAKIVRGINSLRSECKKRGIKVARTDTIEILKAKLGGQVAS